MDPASTGTPAFPLTRRAALRALGAAGLAGLLGACAARVAAFLRNSAPT